MDAPDADGLVRSLPARGRGTSGSAAGSSPSSAARDDQSEREVADGEGRDPASATGARAWGTGGFGVGAADWEGASVCGGRWPASPGRPSESAREDQGSWGSEGLMRWSSVFLGRRCGNRLPAEGVPQSIPPAPARRQRGPVSSAGFPGLSAERGGRQAGDQGLPMPGASRTRLAPEPGHGDTVSPSMLRIIVPLSATSNSGR